MPKEIQFQTLGIHITQKNEKTTDSYALQNNGYEFYAVMSYGKKVIWLLSRDDCNEWWFLKIHIGATPDLFLSDSR